MDYHAYGERLWSELHRMNETVITLRILNEQAYKHPCVFDRYIMFISQIRWALVEALIMGIGRVTDRNKGCLHFGMILTSALRQTPPKVDAKKLAEAKREYDALMASKPMKAAKTIRHVTVAHTAVQPDADECLDGVTWGETYDLVDRLCVIFNHACDARLWGNRIMPPDETYVTAIGMRHLEKDTVSMVEALEAACHIDKLHAKLLRRLQREEQERKELDGPSD